MLFFFFAFLILFPFDLRALFTLFFSPEDRSEEEEDEADEDEEESDDELDFLLTLFLRDLSAVCLGAEAELWL